jgi:predicted metallopeptidase
MEVKEREAEIRHDLVAIATERQCAIDRWGSHAEALHRVGFTDGEELREILQYADPAYGEYVKV